MEEANLYLTIRPIVHYLMKGIFHPEIECKEEIPNEGKIILAGNHVYWFDALLLTMVTDRQVCVLAKEELFKGTKKIFFKSLGCIPVNRDGNGLDAIKETLVALEDGKCIGVFPEGTRNKTDNIILPFKLGTVVIAKRSKADIIPFAITGKYRLIKSNIKITTGNRIKTSEYTSSELLEKLEDDVKCLIKSNRNE